ncbi:DUF6090 family protein [Robiginitalea sp. IMCC44478]|uniref:DUF6090 family protein n=1 Tax=Robiginitalea sp. IMCC44478 TaxID=3459122 RepID=UPI0040421C84
MLRFFRQLRHRLLTDNKFNKYLLYAVGEIILVVIGILIALSINNWNEYRKERIVEKEILQNMAESLEATIQKMQVHIDANEYCERASDIVINTIENKLPYNDSLNKHFGWSLAVEDPGSMISFVGYESLKQAGVEIILNKELRKEIIYLFEETVQLPLARKARIMEFNMELVRLRQKYFLRENGFDFAPFDSELLMEDEIYYSWLRTIKNSRNWYNQSIEDSLEEVKRVLQIIQGELKKPA